MTRPAGRLIGRPGERLFVVERGSGPAVLLVHGFPSNLTAWTRVMDHLPSHRRVIAVDLLGLGRSDRNAGLSHAPAAHADRLVGVLDELALPGVTAVGLSYGGAVVQWLAAAHPERVDRLVLVASVEASRPDRLARHWRLQAMALAAGLSVPPLARRVLAVGLRGEAMDRGLVTPAMVDAYLAPLLLPGTRRSVWAYGRDLATSPRLDPRRIQAPATILAGTEDRTVPIAVARRLATTIPRASLEEIVGARHLLTWDLPGEMAGAIVGR